MNFELSSHSVRQEISPEAIAACPTAKVVCQHQTLLGVTGSERFHYRQWDLAKCGSRL